MEADIDINIATSFFEINIAKTMPIKTELNPIMPAKIIVFSAPTSNEKIILITAPSIEKIPNLRFANRIKRSIAMPKNLFSIRKT